MIDPARAESGTARRLALAASVVASVTGKGRTLEESLAAEVPRTESGDGPALQALSFGTIRLWPRLEAWLALLSDKPRRSVQPIVRSLLAVALHQLQESTHPAHAIVDEAVEAIRFLRAPQATGFVNAILRRFLRERATLEARVLAQATARLAHPLWLIDAVRKDWPDAFERILEANNQPPPLWLRVNRRRKRIEECMTELASAGIAAEPSTFAPEALLLGEPRDVRDIPGFDRGDISVQDAAAQLAAHWLAAAPGMRVLDACAAPGGKACHLLELVPEIEELVALDVDAGRLGRIRENLSRLHLSATLVKGDARRPGSWWDGRPFDRILIDAPCSATGVIRRHPDIKLLRRPADVKPLATLQLEILHALWPLLAPRGRMLYVTCSILQAENHEVVTRFLAEEGSARILPLDAGGPGMMRPESPGRQILTGEAGMDGFYYACLERRKNN
jgi:16S rRNA (cytosine967-C5)-methyltransferase